jgi:hypothetical protein
MDNIAYEDFINFHQAEVKIIEGYYFNGLNKKINEVIKNLFDLRVSIPKSNPANEVIKLIMNSCYGKTALRPSESIKKIIPNKEWEDYLQRHYKRINRFIPCKKNTIVDIEKNVLNHFNRVHCGSLILSMSK